MLGNSLLSLVFLVTLFKAGTWRDLLLWQARKFKSSPVPCSVPMDSSQAAVLSLRDPMQLKSSQLNPALPNSPGSNGFTAISQVR